MIKRKEESRSCHMTALMCGGYALDSVTYKIKGKINTVDNKSASNEQKRFYIFKNRFTE